MVEVAILVEVVRDILGLLNVEVDFERVGAGDAGHLEHVPWPVPGDGPGAGDEGFSAGDRVFPCDVDIVGGDHDDGVLLEGELDGGGGRGRGFKRGGSGRSRRMLSSTKEGGQSYMMALLG